MWTHPVKLLFGFQVESVNSDGSSRRTILTTANHIHKPRALAVMDRRLYYLDPVYEKVVRVNLPNGDEPKILLDNESDLRTLNMYRKRPSELSRFNLHFNLQFLIAISIQFLTPIHVGLTVGAATTFASPRLVINASVDVQWASKKLLTPRQDARPTNHSQLSHSSRRWEVSV